MILINDANQTRSKMQTKLNQRKNIEPSQAGLTRYKGNSSPTAYFFPLKRLHCDSVQEKPISLPFQLTEIVDLHFTFATRMSKKQVGENRNLHRFISPTHGY